MESGGTPKSSILMGCSLETILNDPFGGTPMTGKPHMLDLKCFLLPVDPTQACKGLQTPEGQVDGEFGISFGTNL